METGASSGVVIMLMPVSLLFLEIDKSSADVAAEGAILNEMLEIVKKRAALRPSDTMVGSDGYEVSDGRSPSTTPHSTPTTTTTCTTPSSTLHALFPCENSFLLIASSQLLEHKRRRRRNRSWITIQHGAIIGALFAILVLIVAFVYPALIVSCLEG